MYGYADITVGIKTGHSNFKMFKDFFFEYIYYRLFQLNTNKGEFQGVPPAVVISLVQIAFLVEFLILGLRYVFEISTSAYSKQIGYVAVLLYIVTTFYNYGKYSDRNSIYEERWGDEDSTVRFKKGMLVFVAIVLPFLPLLLYAEF